MTDENIFKTAVYFDERVCSFFLTVEQRKVIFVFIYFLLAMGAVSLEELEEMEEEFASSENESLQADFRQHKDAYYLDKMKQNPTR